MRKTKAMKIFVAALVIIALFLLPMAISARHIGRPRTRMNPSRLLLLLQILYFKKKNYKEVVETQYVYIIQFSVALNVLFSYLLLGFLLRLTFVFFFFFPFNADHGHHHSTQPRIKDGTVAKPNFLYRERWPEKRRGADTVQIAGSSLPDCSHACGSCSPCRLVMVSFICASLEEAETCPMAYKCMCNNKSYPVPWWSPAPPPPPLFLRENVHPPWLNCLHV